MGSQTNLLKEDKLVSFNGYDGVISMTSAIFTRCPSCCRRRPMKINGCTSPRVPHTSSAMCSPRGTLNDIVGPGGLGSAESNSVGPSSSVKLSDRLTQELPLSLRSPVGVTVALTAATTAASHSSSESSTASQSASPLLRSV